MAKNLDTGRYLLAESTRIWAQLKDLFRIIDRGSPPLHVATFNGGLFDPNKHRFLEQHSVGDLHLQRAIDKLARVDKNFVDYRDLSPRHLGTIYEGLLEFYLTPRPPSLTAPASLGKGESKPESSPFPADEGGESGKGAGGLGEGLQISLRNDKGERKATGSYYTPDYLVKYIVERTLHPLLERAVADKTDDADCIEAVLKLRVLDPAMGSGHFLVEAADTIARYLVDIAVSPEEVAPGEADLAYWKRRVVQSCIYGVDLNPLAVELAKLSLWLTTVANNRPLSFLDHHLRPGNTLIGGKLATLQTVTQLRVASRTKKKKPNGDALAAQESAGQLSLIYDEGFRTSMTDAVLKMRDIDFTEADTVRQVKRQEELYNEMRADLGGKFGRLANLVTATHFGVEFDAGFWPELMEFAAGRTDELRWELKEKLKQAERLAVRYGFFHWELEFPEVYFNQQGESLGAEAGFHAVVGNPPWEQMSLAENEFFGTRDAAIATAPNGAKRKQLIAALVTTNPSLWRAYEAARDQADSVRNYCRTSKEYPLCGRGKTNLYAVFAEKALRSVRADGRIGLLVPSGIATDDTTKSYFQELVNRRRLSELLDFENRDAIFPDVHRSFKFCILLMTGEHDPQSEVRCGFFLHNMNQLEDPERVFTLTPDDFKLFNPNTLTCPMFRRRRDMELTRKIYKVPIFIEQSKGSAGNPWSVSFKQGLFNMTTDSASFRTAAEMEAEGCWLGAGNVYTKGLTLYLPLYEGKLVQAYDHRAANIVINPENLFRPAQQVPVTLAEHQDADFSPLNQYWVEESLVLNELKAMPDQNSLICFKDVTAPTNFRTFIASFIPIRAAGHNLPLIFVAKENQALRPCLLANLNSFALDYVARQKIGGQHLTYFYIEQFPVLPPERYAETWHGVVLADFIRPRVLELCYTAHDLKGFADDMGYTGPPFAWDEERRLHLRCQLDALYFHLYGLTAEEAADILDTFPIVQRQDEAKYGGRFRTRDLILAYARAFAAGNLDAQVKG